MDTKEINFADKGLSFLKIGKTIDTSITLKKIDASSPQVQNKYIYIAYSDMDIHHEVIGKYKIEGISEFKGVYVGLNTSNQIMSISLNCEQSELNKIMKLLVHFYGEFDFKTTSGMNGIETGYGFFWNRPDCNIHLMEKYNILLIQYTKRE